MAHVGCAAHFQRPTLPQLLVISSHKLIPHETVSAHRFSRRAQQHKRQRIPHAAQDDLRGDYFQADPNRDKAPIRRNGIEEPDEATRRDQPQAQQDAQARAEAQAPRGAQAQMRGQAVSGDTPHATSGAGQPSAQAQEGAQAQQGGGNGDQYRIPGDGLQLTPQEEYDAVVGEDYALSGRRFMSDADAISIIGMGTWRLRSFVSPAIYTLAAWLEGTWRHSLELDLGRAHVDHELLMCDSMDLDYQHNGLAWMEVPNPGSGEPGYPRVLIESRVYESSLLRKMHLMVGVRQDGLMMLHCTVVPRLDWDIPIYSLDMLENNGRVTLASCDLFPVRSDATLPEGISSFLEMLREELKVQSLAEVPAWAEAALSRYSLLMQPSTPEQLTAFLRYAGELHRQYMKASCGIRGMPDWRERSAKLRGETHAAHERYVKAQLQHNKTRLVVERAFGAEWADVFMRRLMFDLEPLAPVPAEAPAGQSNGPGPAEGNGSNGDAGVTEPQAGRTEQKL